MSVVAAVFLTTFKMVVGFLTGSLGILSEALHSLLDFVAAFITFIAVKISDKPADKDHNFGHGKIENLSALIETGLLIATCVWIVYEALERLASGNTQIEVSFWAYAVVITSICVDFFRSRALMKAAKEHNSQALEADALHFSTDILSSAVVLAGLIMAHYGYFFADCVAALAVACIVVFVSLRLGARSIDDLLDKAPKEAVGKISMAISSVDDIIYFHDLRVRNSGADMQVEVSIHVDPHLTILQAHDIAEKLEKAVQTVEPRADVHVHIEPESEGSANLHRT